jgi:hypothetical protein
MSLLGRRLPLVVPGPGLQHQEQNKCCMLCQMPRATLFLFMGVAHLPADLPYVSSYLPTCTCRSTDESLDELEAVTEEGSASMRSDRHLAGEVRVS